MSSQFEEGRHYAAHLLQAPQKSKAAAPPGSDGQVRLHLQNRRFSITCGAPPRLLHTWRLADLRRYGALDGDRFCFEGGSRCGRGGEGAVVLGGITRAPGAGAGGGLVAATPDELAGAFDLAARGKLGDARGGRGAAAAATNGGGTVQTLDSNSKTEKNRNHFYNLFRPVSSSPSTASCLGSSYPSAGGSDDTLSTVTSCTAAPPPSTASSTAALLPSSSSSSSNENHNPPRCRSRSQSRSTLLTQWPSAEGAGGSSCETTSVALTEVEVKVEDGGGAGAAAMGAAEDQQEHRVNRRALLERAGIRDEAKASKGKISTHRSVDRYVP